MVRLSACAIKLRGSAVGDPVERVRYASADFMICRRSFLVFWTLLLTTSAAPDSAHATPPLKAFALAGHANLPPGRTARDIEGWKVLVDDRLLTAPNEAVGARALKFLDAKLVEIKTVVPAARVKELQTIAIVLDLSCGKLTAMQYHPDAGWLKSNGYTTDLAKCVHLPRAADLPTRRNINEQPWVILHELAHGYHDQVLGFDEPRIRAAYEEFKNSGRGDKTLLFDGRRVKHYGLTDHKEFFAEMTESYFGVNDFFPFNRAELKGAEPKVYELLSQIWSSYENR
jgi:hypothetical protein